MCIYRRKLKPILQKRAARFYCSLPLRRSVCSTNHRQRGLGFFTSPVENITFQPSSKNSTKTSNVWLPDRPHPAPPRPPPRYRPPRRGSLYKSRRERPAFELGQWLTLRRSSAILRSWTTGTIAIAI